MTIPKYFTMEEEPIDPKLNFKTVYDLFLNTYRDEFNSSIEKARNKKLAFVEFRSQFSAAYLIEQQTFPAIIPALTAFQKEFELDKNISFEEILEQSSQYKEHGTAFIILLASAKSKQDFGDFLNSHPLNNSEIEEPFQSAEEISFISWDPKFSQRDFLKIIYALKESGNLKGDITRIVPHVASALNFKLSNEWQTNFSKGHHKNNHDFNQGQVFDTLKSAFQSYVNRQVDKHLKKSEK